MDVSNILTPQVLNTALLIMQKATVTGDQAYAYVQTAESFKVAIKLMTQPKEATDGSDSKAVDEQGSEGAAAD